NVEQHIRRAFHFAGVESAQAFIEQQYPGMGRERPRELELLERGGPEAVRGRSRFKRQTHHGQCFLRAFARLRTIERAGFAVERRERHILDERELAKRPGVLERAANAARQVPWRGAPATS